MKFSRSTFAKAAAAVLVLGAAGTASVAHARDNVYFSIGANVAPGVVVSASNAPVYYGAPVYAAPVYTAPAPVYYGYGYGAPVVVAPAPVVGVQYYWSPVHRRYYYYQHGHRHWR